MTEVTPPYRPTREDVSCNITALRHDITQARDETDRAERLRLAREIRGRLTALRTQVDQLEPADRGPIQADLDAAAREHGELAVLLIDEPALPSDTTTEPPLPPEPEPVDQPPVTPPVAVNPNVFVPPHPTPTTFTQRFDNMVARLAFYAGRAGSWIKARFQQNPTAAPVMTALGTTALFGVLRNVFGGSTVTSTLETQMSQSLNTMAGSVDILQPLLAQLQVVGLTLNRVNGDDGQFQILKTLQQNAIGAGTDGNVFLQSIAQRARVRYRGAVTAVQLVQIARETTGIVPPAGPTSINIPPAGLNVARGFNQTYLITPPTVPVTVNGAPLTAAAPARLGQLTITRTPTGIRVQRSNLAAPIATVTVVVGTPPTTVSRTLRVAA